MSSPLAIIPYCPSRDCHTDFLGPSSGSALPQKVARSPDCSQNKVSTALLLSVPADPAALPPSLLLHFLLPSPHLHPVLEDLQGSVPEACSKECLYPLLHARPSKLYPSTETRSLFQVLLLSLSPVLWLQIKHQLLHSSQSALCHGDLCSPLIFFTSLRIHGEQRQEISFPFLCLRLDTELSIRYGVAAHLLVGAALCLGSL